MTVGEVVELIREATGEDAAWCARVDARTRLDGDLYLDSVEMAALGGLLARRYGPGVDLAAYLAGLELDQLVALTVADLVDFVSACTVDVYTVERSRS